MCVNALTRNRAEGKLLSFKEDQTEADRAAYDLHIHPILPQPLSTQRGRQRLRSAYERPQALSVMPPTVMASAGFGSRSTRAGLRRASPPAQNGEQTESLRFDSLLLLHAHSRFSVSLLEAQKAAQFCAISASKGSTETVALCNLATIPAGSLWA